MVNRDYNGRDSILAVVLEVHGVTTGSIESYSSFQNADIRLLKKKLKEWQPSTGNGGKYKGFDDAVFNLIEVVIEESETEY